MTVNTKITNLCNTDKLSAHRTYKRTISKKAVAFSNSCEKIRFRLYHYLSLDYVCNEVREGVRKVTIKKQKKTIFVQDLFSG